LPFSPDLFEWSTVRLWLPAHLLGLGLWLASRRTSHPALFPCFVLGVSALTHAVRVGTGTSLAQAQASHWLMAPTAGRPCSALWAAAYDFGAVQWSLLTSADALKELACAVLFGPVVNTLLNLVLIGPVIEQTVAMPDELRAAAAGSAATALGGGYSNYLAVSNTAIHRKCGGTDRASCACAAAVAATFFCVHPLFHVVGYVPTLVVSAICVYIGLDFLYDNVVDFGMDNGLWLSLASWAVLLTCLLQDMMVGVVVGVVSFQLYAALSTPAAAHAVVGGTAAQQEKPEADGVTSKPQRAQSPTSARKKSSKPSPTAAGTPKRSASPSSARQKSSKPSTPAAKDTPARSKSPSSSMPQKPKASPIVKNAPALAVKRRARSPSKKAA